MGLFANVLPVPVLAQEGAETTGDSNQQQIDDLQKEVKDRQAAIQQLTSNISAYNKRIAEQENATLTLENQSLLLDNRIQEKSLALQKTTAEAEVTSLQIRELDVQLRRQEEEIQKRRAALGELLRRIRDADDVQPFEALLVGRSLSEYLTQLDELQRVQDETVAATKNLHQAKAGLEATKRSQEERHQNLLKQQTALTADRDALEEEKDAKQSLLAETQNKESEFQRIVSQLRQQQQEEKSNIQDLQTRLSEQLNESDSLLAQGDVLFQWPVPPKRGVSAHFHDRSYPFRNLFEHPGTDIPTPVGTPIRAAAGGYIAWTRTGTQYGNYIMVVHAGNLATVYAHLSRFAVRPDTYVERGQVIGYSGGRPGDQGAGLSTGPHLHFEVRQGGIPINPENFLPEIVE